MCASKYYDQTMALNSEYFDNFYHSPTYKLVSVRCTWMPSSQNLIYW